MHVQLGQITNNTVQKGQKPTATSRCREQKQGPVLAPFTTHHQGGGQMTWATPVAWPTHLPLTFTPVKELACPPQSEHGHLCLVFAPSCCRRSPSKVLLEFLVWPFTNFYWLKNPRPQVGNTFTLDGFHFANRLTPTSHFSLQIMFSTLNIFFPVCESIIIPKSRWPDGTYSRRAVRSSI